MLRRPYNSPRDRSLSDTFQSSSRSVSPTHPQNTQSVDAEDQSWESSGGAPSQRLRVPSKGAADVAQNKQAVDANDQSWESSGGAPSQRLRVPSKGAADIAQSKQAVDANDQCWESADGGASQSSKMTSKSSNSFHVRKFSRPSPVQTDLAQLQRTCAIKTCTSVRDHYNLTPSKHKQCLLGTEKMDAVDVGDAGRKVCVELQKTRCFSSEQDLLWRNAAFLLLRLPSFHFLPAVSEVLRDDTAYYIVLTDDGFPRRSALIRSDLVEDVKDLTRHILVFLISPGSMASSYSSVIDQFCGFRVCAPSRGSSKESSASARRSPSARSSDSSITSASTIKGLRSGSSSPRGSSSLPSSLPASRQAVCPDSSDEHPSSCQPSSDLMSLGIIVYTLLTGTSPICDLVDWQICWQHRIFHKDPGAQSFLMLLLGKERPLSAAEALLHPWLCRELPRDGSPLPTPSQRARESKGSVVVCNLR